MGDDRQGEHRQPVLTLVPRDAGNTTADVWEPVMDGFQRALELSGGAHPQHEVLLQCLRVTRQLAGRPPVAAVLEAAGR